jgi:hypothetical protein
MIWMHGFIVWVMFAKFEKSLNLEKFWRSLKFKILKKMFKVLKVFRV